MRSSLHVCIYIYSFKFLFQQSKINQRNLPATRKGSEIRDLGHIYFLLLLMMTGEDIIEQIDKRETI